MAEKTEKPTPKKIKDARKKGQVAQTPDIPKLLTCGIIFEVLVAVSQFVMEDMQSLVYLPISLVNVPFQHAFNSVLDEAIRVLLVVILIVAPLCLIANLFGRWAQFGMLVAPEALKPDINKLNPFTQLKQLFSGQKLTEILNNIFKSSVVLGLFYFLLNQMIGDIMKLPYLSLDNLWVATVELFAFVARVCLLALLFPAMVDFALKKFFHLKQLKMDKQEIKQEYKDSEGDPMLKSQRKQLGFELMEGPPKQPQNVAEADMLVVNPSHFAIGLSYKEGATPLPVIVVKGRDSDALELISQAHTLQIPVIRFVWLARTLYRVELGDYILRETLEAVASVYIMVQNMSEEHEDFNSLPIEKI
ncbi:type III secretion system export apparatus subunit SctU [Vibrio chagasii]|uniref:EscU/YscU/HrcU family type III secretion system export apparatus switch protein n=1 Tax=Vibrio chagasii TaxID=170679 RepID=A0A7Y3YSM9_9VIBR|nr:type III secretion system export apparatus subunit SctU [Vibrio chagasii]NOH35999.1 EscU/YscU/HrcU family type III secretion system export apparatus switch protein [Vibrio chagasii]